MADHDVEDLDYSRAFLLAPVGLAIARERTIVDCNLALADMFRRDRDALIGKTFAALYPDEQHFVDTGERVGRVLQTQETFANDRVMRRLDGELFWVHVRGRTLRREYPHQDTLWVFTEVAGAFAARNAPKGSEGNKRSDCAGEPKMPSGFNNRSRFDYSLPSPKMFLTGRERDIAALFVEGKTAKEAALLLRISPRTVDIYRSRLLRKYSVSSTYDLVRRLTTG